MIHYLEPAPSYYFIKPLPATSDGFTRHDTTLECKVSNSMAVVGWYKGTAKLAVSERTPRMLYFVCIIREPHKPHSTAGRRQVRHIQRHERCLSTRDQELPAGGQQRVLVQNRKTERENSDHYQHNRFVYTSTSGGGGSSARGIAK